MREYIYISDAKLTALGQLLPARTRDRLRELNVSVGPVGGGVALSDATGPTRHQVIEAIEAGIREVREVAEPTAAHLAPGDWIGVDRVRSRFGALTEGGMLALAAAVFVADLGDTGVVLAGSLVHLLRPMPAGQRVDLVNVASSGPTEIGQLLLAAAEEDEGKRERDWESAAMGAFGYINGKFARFAPPQPVSFLARVTHVAADEGRNPRRVVVGTPLYVALS